MTSEPSVHFPRKYLFPGSGIPSLYSASPTGRIVAAIYNKHIYLFSVPAPDTDLSPAPETQPEHPSPSSTGSKWPVEIYGVEIAHIANADICGLAVHDNNEHGVTIWVFTKSGMVSAWSIPATTIANINIKSSSTDTWTEDTTVHTDADGDVLMTDVPDPNLAANLAIKDEDEVIAIPISIPVEEEEDILMVDQGSELMVDDDDYEEEEEEDAGAGAAKVDGGCNSSVSEDDHHTTVEIIISSGAGDWIVECLC